ncbi:hypothetical protein WR25_21165 [Diploscapter pachys]|uniref:GPI alpha-1,4-mannosyltransferase I, catalytic subunit n=1 Tax=Diploscapter pachys TaxID=2018661 RepID=A0A2A2LEG5_9BILA|nr:hypothetical protein WR25_21165 [Diploscapter pachys]
MLFVTAGWSRTKVLLIAFSARLVLVMYSNIHDYIFKVNFTDIDYQVFSDAVMHVAHGRSPFERATYRYTPALAWLLLPISKWRDFGKVLFCICDILVAMLCFEIMRIDRRDGREQKPGRSKTEQKKETEETERTIQAEELDSDTCAVLICWLVNPLTAVISARGNADVLVCAAVLLVLLLLKRDQWVLAALVHGLLAIHLKIYPLIYIPSIYLHFCNVKWNDSLMAKANKLLLNWKGLIYTAICLLSFAAVVFVFYRIYGEQFLEEFLLYHVKRRDIRHNFSPYFYVLYLLEDDPSLSRLFGFAAFLPQIVCVVYFAFRYSEDLPFCWFLTTFAFVAFNKVCTSQYFVWYFVLLPLVVDRIQMSWDSLKLTLGAWLLSQGAWLLFAYLFEFRGWPTFELIWLSSLAFLLSNAFALNRVITFYRPSAIQYKTKTVHSFVMVFYLIGLGLGDVEDITVKGLRIVKQCARVHLEAYTSILCYGLDKSKLEAFYGREVIEADRTAVEQNSDSILEGANKEDVALLVVGDPFGATTHADLVLRAKQSGIEVRVIHNASIMNAVGCCGLQLYNFGETVSIVMWTDEWQPDSYYEKIEKNINNGMHTLCLLDIKTKEQTVENMMKGRPIYEPPRYLTCKEAARQLLTIAARKMENGIKPAYSSETMCVGMARVGWDTQKIVYCSLQELAEFDGMGDPLHSLIIPGQTHPLEVQMLETFKLTS